MKIRLHRAVDGVAEAGAVVELPDSNVTYRLLSQQRLGVQLPPYTPVTVDLTDDQVERLLGRPLVAS